MRPREIAALRQRGSAGKQTPPYTAPTRQTVVISTGSLATNASWTGTVTLARGYRLIAIATNRACRTRVYTDTTARSSDASRPIGTDPTDGSGVVLEFVSTSGLLSAILSPVVDGFSGATPSSDQIPVAVTNLGSTGSVDITLTFIVTEV